MQQPRIAIVGGGPGGLTLARILQTRGIAAAVFEADAAADERPQGGTLDLHPNTGQHALHLAGLDAEFRAIARPEDQGMRLYDKAGTLVFDEQDASEGDRPEVDRTALRRMLLDSLAPGAVRWGHKLRAAEICNDGTCALAFANDSAETFDLVVGADGAWSRVRPLVSTAKPSYSGVSFVEMGLDDVDNRHPELAALVGRGLMFALGDGKALIAQRNGHAHVRVYAVLRVPEAWALGDAVDFSDPDTARHQIAALFTHWAPALLDLVAKSEGRVRAWPLYALPVGHTWDTRAGVTLIGDAAHVMSPFSGEGVNLAMRDASDLALALAENADWPDAVRGYEQTMFVRAEQAAMGAAHALDNAISERGLQEFLEFMQGTREGG